MVCAAGVITGEVFNTPWIDLILRSSRLLQVLAYTVTALFCHWVCCWYRFDGKVENDAAELPRQWRIDHVPYSLWSWPYLPLGRVER